jgi:hypothetical protein
MVPAARQQIPNSQQLNQNIVKWCFIHGPCEDVIGRAGGGGVEYHHHSSVSSECDKKEFSNLRQQNMVVSPTGLGPDWRGPAEIVNDRPVLSSESVPHTNKSATV